MPPNQSTSAHQARDQHALWDTITAMGRDHDGLCHRLARVNGMGLHQDSRYRGPTDKDGNLLTMWKGYWLAGIGAALLWAGHLHARRPRQHSYKLRHPVYKPILETGMVSLEYRPSALDSLPSPAGWADGAAKPDNEAVSPGSLQLRAGQLARTLAANRIRLR